MARLNVQAAVIWTGHEPDEVLLPLLSTFQGSSIQMVLSVTNQDGAVVQDVLEDHVHVEYVTEDMILNPPMHPENTPVQLTFFRQLGPTSGGTGWYATNLSPRPHGTEPSSGWPSSEVFLCVTVQRGVDRGQTVVHAKNRRVLP